MLSQNKTNLPHEPIEYQPLILIGAARSGTKLIRDLIAEHPAIDKVPYDINYVWRLGNEHLPHDELLHTTLTTAIQRRILKQIHAFHSAETPVLIEKTVSNCLRIPYVQAIFPNAKFIHLVRDGRDVIESVHRQWLAPPDWKYILQKARSFPAIEAYGYAFAYIKTIFRKLTPQNKYKVGTWGPRYNGIDQDVATKTLLEVCAIQWVYCVEKTLKDLCELPDQQVLTIYYENFVQNPNKCLEYIYQFIGIDPLLHSQKKFETILTNNIGKGLQNLTSEQTNLVLPIMNNLLSRLNYI